MFSGGFCEETEQVARDVRSPAYAQVVGVYVEEPQEQAQSDREDENDGCPNPGIELYRAETHNDDWQD